MDTREIKAIQIVITEDDTIDDAELEAVSDQFIREYFRAYTELAK